MKALAQIRQYFTKANQTPLERKLVLKLDFFILTFCCLAYFTNYLDRASVTQAYVSGMREDLGFEGAQLTTVTTLYAVGYLIGIVPNNLLLTRFKPRHFFPAMITIWALLTMVNAAAKTPQHLMAIRFFQGYFESCIFAGTQYILGSWYTKSELGQRTGLFTASGLAGGMFGGFLQAGIYSSMNGLHGLPGWRWLFIISGIITLPVAIYGYIFFPDTPATTSAFYLTPQERQLAVQRTPPPPEGEPILTKRFLMNLVTSWPFYAFCILWILGNCSESQSNQSLLNLYMQGHPERNYTVFQMNNWPAAVQGVGIFSTLLWAIGTDIFGFRWVSGYYVSIVCIANAVMILINPTTIATKFAAYYWAGTVYCIQTTFFAWANDSMRGRPAAQRAAVIACMNAAGNCFQAWWPLVFFRADDAPEFTRGMYSIIGVGAGLAVWTTVLVVSDRRQAKRATVEVLDGVEGSSVGQGIGEHTGSEDVKGAAVCKV
ncbi:major facilitator superfamily domain-containing protein [Aspergillus stella-maris]|uniref:major facilitator superfamily domain-containing protein n=1 Tax=Aspergillus stella-maris TaxID=1810926 RepID=UPI003CCD46F0